MGDGRSAEKGVPRVEGPTRLEREHIFRGNALNAVDAKGRLSVPAFIRQKIELRSDDKVLVLVPHADFPCLVGYDTNHSATLLERAEQRLGEDPETAEEMQMQAALFGSAMDVPYDTSGRIILPPRLKRRAEIADGALFIGMIREFHIWNPEHALKCDVEAIRRIAADAIEDRRLAA